ncbi:hypothetical protein [Dactylosporangium sp. CA-092794]|uniref:hypothetical protein n=1 Tax=Dactylosporangium sp. CA-092794 TaxID=3239929 RepID=UPI003D9364E3
MLIALATGVGALLAGTTAYAAFSASSTFTTTSKAATMTPLTVVSSETDYEGDQTGLWPGHPADVLLTVANANEVPVKVLGFAWTSFLASPSCTGLNNFQIANGDLANGAVVPARTGRGPGQATIRLTNAVTLSPDAPDGCQGATVTVNWSVVVQAA